MIKSETSILKEQIQSETQKIAKDIIRLEKKIHHNVYFAFFL
jgi:hypothetical protein